MPVTSEHFLDIPDCSLATLLFKSPSTPLQDSSPAFIDPKRPDTHFLTAASHRLWSQRLALGLRRLGFKDGDRLLLFSPNDLFFPVVFMGTIMAGGIFSGANPNYVSREVAYQLKDTEAFCLLCAEPALKTGIEAASIAGLPKSRVFVFNNQVFDGQGSDLNGCKYWGSILASAEDARSYQWPTLDSSPDEPHRTLALNYSSGTTGVPKGVEITHRNYISNLLQYNHRASLDKNFVAKTARSRWLCFIPMYHAMAQTIFVACAFLRGIPVYIMPKFDFIEVLGYIQQFRITDFITVPPVAVALAKAPVVKNYDLSSIETVGSGAAPLGAEVSREVEALWPPGKINVKQGWGMTEATCSILGWTPTERSESYSVGRPNANCSAKIMVPPADQPPNSTDHASFTEIPPRSGPSHPGELWVQGPNVMKGYWRNPEATKATLTPDGWLRTGDIAFIDEDERFYIVDRIKELIKVKGYQVAPAELEALLLEHPSIADAGVVGTPWPPPSSSSSISSSVKIDDERPKAFVVLKPSPSPSPSTAPENGNGNGRTKASVSESEIARWVQDRTARHKWLEGGVEFVAEVPRNPSGKILRGRLREMAALNGNGNGRGGPQVARL